MTDVFRKAGFLLAVAVLLASCSLNSKVFYTRSASKDISQLAKEEVTLTADDGHKLYCLFLKPDSAPAVATIFLLQGNGGNVTTWADVARPFVKHGYQVFLMGYPGYGLSEGRPTFPTVFRDSELALRYVRERPEVKDTRLVVLGYSLGGNFAVKLASEHPDLVDALVLEGTFTTLNAEATYLAPALLKPISKLIVKSSYNSKSLIRRLRMPKLIVHSREDRVVPFRMGEELYRQAAEPKMFWEITGRHCRGVLDFESDYIQKLTALLKQEPAR